MKMGPREGTGGTGPAAAPRWAGPLGLRAGIALFALLGLALSGCRLDGCKDCSLRNGLSQVGRGVRNAGARVFNRGSSGACCDGAEPAIGGEAVEYGSIEPGLPVVPGVPPLAPIETAPQILEPAPTAEPAPAASVAPTGAGKAAYEALRPRDRGRGTNYARAMLPTDRTTREAAKPAASSPLDNLPPLEASADPAAVARPAEPPKAGPVAVEIAPKAAPEASETLSGIGPITLGPPVVAVDPVPEPASNPTPVAIPAPEPVEAAPGLAKFYAVGPKLAGGGVPNATGLDWLAEKGYKTIIDLRGPEKIHAGFITDVSSRGLRYVAFPVQISLLNDAMVSRFRSELAQTSAQPIYFFDDLGANAGLLWYLQRVETDHVDLPVARREAEGVGIIDAPRWAAAATFLDTLKKPAPDQTTKAPIILPALPASAAIGKDASASGSRSAVAEAIVSELPADPFMALPGLPPARGLASWKPYATLALTILGIPLAYWGRIQVGHGRVKLASLPGVVRTRKALPPASGV